MHFGVTVEPWRPNLSFVFLKLLSSILKFLGVLAISEFDKAIE